MWTLEKKFHDLSRKQRIGIICKMFTVVHFRGVGGVNWVKYGRMHPKSDYISTFRLKLGWNIRWCTLHVYIFERESNGKR